MRWDGVSFGEVLKEQMPHVRLCIMMSLKTAGYDVGCRHRRNLIIESNLLTTSMQCIANAIRVRRLANEEAWSVASSATVV